jgi:glycolate oxidase iron-sulfur subunit
MGEMMESFREQLNRSEARGAAGPLGRFCLQHLLPHRERLALLTDALDLYERTGLSKLVTKLLAKSPSASRLHAMRPALPPRSSRRIETDRTRPQGFRAEGEHRATVALFLGCIASEWFAPVHRATIRVLQRNGCDVVIPNAQTCCGALHRHAGCLEDALSLEDRNRTAFSAVRIDAVIVNAAGCGASLKEPVIRDVESTVKYVDVCEYLDDLGIRPPTRAIPRKVTYDQPCHLVHGQKIGAAVVENLLKTIPQIEIVPLSRSERCCGAGGIYNLLHPEMAEPVLREKVAAIRASGAEIVVTGNPGCIMQIRGGLQGTNVEVLHPVELLYRAYTEVSS